MTEAFTYEEEFGPDERYRIYERGADRRKPKLIATCPSATAVGTALVQLAEDRWEAEDWSTPVVGVLDSERGRWVSGLWNGGGLL
jgi:hypothetical protein